MTPQDATLIATLCGVLVPILVGVLTKLQAPSGLKAFLNCGLSALGGLVATIVPADFQWRSFLTAWATTWVVSIATYAGLWKPTGIAGAVQGSTQNTGIG